MKIVSNLLLLPVQTNTKRTHMLRRVGKKPGFQKKKNPPVFLGFMGVLVLFWGLSFFLDFFLFFFLGFFCANPGILIQRPSKSIGSATLPVTLGVGAQHIDGEGEGKDRDNGERAGHYRARSADQDAARAGC